MWHTRHVARWAALIVSLVTLGSIVFGMTVVGQSSGAKMKTPPPDPYQNGTTSERATAYTQGLQSHLTRRAQFIQNFQASGQNPATLQRITKAASYAPPLPSLSEALKTADLVIDGTVTKVVFTPSATIATIHISNLQKASSAATARLGIAQPTDVQVALGYSVEPDSSYTTGRLIVPENEPVLLPGSHATLFLQVDASVSTPRFSIQSFTGSYEITPSGTIAPVSGNPFAAQVQGLTPDQFAARVAGELSKIAP